MEARDISVSFVLKKNLWGKPVTKIDAVRNVSLALYEGKTLRRCRRIRFGKNDSWHVSGGFD